MHRSYSYVVTVFFVLPVISIFSILYIDVAPRLKIISRDSSLRKMSKSALTTSTYNEEIFPLGMFMFRRSFNQALKSTCKFLM